MEVIGNPTEKTGWNCGGEGHWEWDYEEPEAIGTTWARACATKDWQLAGRAGGQGALLWRRREEFLSHCVCQLGSREHPILGKVLQNSPRDFVNPHREQACFSKCTNCSHYQKQKTRTK